MLPTDTQQTTSVYATKTSDRMYSSNGLPISSNASSTTKSAFGSYTSYGDGSTSSQYLMVLLSAIGMIASGLVLFEMLSKRLLRKNTTNKFICNQMMLDAGACLALFVRSLLQLGGVVRYDSGALGWFLCWTFGGHYLATGAAYASQAGLVVITLERYFKIVHPIGYRNRFRPWMAALGLILPWIDGIATILIPSWATTRPVNGYCLQTWRSAAEANAYGVAMFVWQFLLPLFVFIFCYSKIIIAVRRQAKIAALSNHPSAITPSTSAILPVDETLDIGNQAQRVRHTPQQSESMMSTVEKNVMKTMAIVTACYIICWFPVEIFTTLYPFVSLPIEPIFILTILAYINIILNPIIYGAHYKVFRRLVFCVSSRKGIVGTTPSLESAEREAGGVSFVTNKTGVTKCVSVSRNTSENTQMKPSVEHF